MNNQDEPRLNALENRVNDQSQVLSHLQREFSESRERITNLTNSLAAQLARPVEQDQRNRQLEVSKWLWAAAMAIIGYLVINPPWDKLLNDKDAYYYLLFILLLFSASAAFAVPYAVRLTPWWWRLQLGTFLLSVALSYSLLTLFSQWHEKTLKLQLPSLTYAGGPITMTYSGDPIPTKFPTDATVGLNVGIAAIPLKIPKDKIPLDTIGSTLKLDTSSSPVQLASNQKVTLDTGKSSIPVSVGDAKLPIDPQSLKDLAAVKTSLEALRECLNSFKECEGLSRKLDGIINLTNSIEYLRPERSIHREK